MPLIPIHFGTTVLLTHQTFKKFDQNASQLPECHLHHLTVYRLDRTYSVKENTLSLPSSHNIHLIPCHGLRPRRALIASPCPSAPCYIPRLEIRTIGDESVVFRQMNNLGLRDDEYFRAQIPSLALQLLSRLASPLPV